MTPERLTEMRKIAEAAERDWTSPWIIDDATPVVIAAFDPPTSLALVAAAEECHQLRIAFEAIGEDPCAWAGMCEENEGLTAERDRLATENDKLKSEVERLTANYPGGDQDSQSRAWSAVWAELERDGMLELFCPSLLGRDRAVHFIRHLAAENAKLVAERDALAKACKMVLQRWTFDNDQQHTHNWHAMADCFEVIRSTLGESS